MIEDARLYIRSGPALEDISVIVVVVSSVLKAIDELGQRRKAPPLIDSRTDNELGVQLVKLDHLLVGFPRSVGRT